MSLNLCQKNALNPQVLYNINKKKYYLAQILKTKKLANKQIPFYTPRYFQTVYDRVLFPNASLIPN
jgi:hypothetical protein